MPIYTNTLIVQGALQSTALYAGSVGGAGGSNVPLAIASDVTVAGSVSASGRVDVGAPMYMTMRAVDSNVPLGGAERPILTGDMQVDMDPRSTDATALAQLADVWAIWDGATGNYTVPLDGLYALQLQGAFSNADAGALNSAYFYALDGVTPGARLGASMARAPLVRAALTGWFRAGERVRPAFASSDSNATLLAGTGETLLNFVLMARQAPAASAAV